jgi:hypothetical protein
MTAEPDLHAGLRRVTEQLDRAGAPTDAAAVIGRRPPASPRPARAVLATAAVLALLVGLVALLAGEDQDEGVKADVPPASVTTDGEGTTTLPDSSPSTETTVPEPGPIVPASYEGMSWEVLPERGLAFLAGGRVTLTDLAGTDLASFAQADLPGVGNSAADPILVGPGPTVEVGEPGTPEADGCSSTGRAGVRVAICGEEQGELVRLAPSGERTPLSGLAFGAIVGRWRVAAPSPDGRWVLGTFSAECEVPTAVLVPADGGPLRTADGFTGDDALRTAATSYSVEWTDDGQAVVVFEGESGCGTADPAPGVYRIDPDSGARTVLRAGTFDRVLRWERTGDHESELAATLDRARDELGLTEGTGGDHGSPGVDSSVMWEGRSIPVAGYLRELSDGVPVGSRHADGVAPGEVDGLPVTTFLLDGSNALAFTCGDAFWLIGGDGTWVRTAEALRDLAATLIPRLSCTVGEAPTIGEG